MGGKVDIIQVVIMGAVEARLLVTEINDSIASVGDKLWELKDREGWKSLGYPSWRECCMAEFNFSQSRVYQLLTHAQVSHNITNFSTNVEKPTNEAQSRALSKLPADQQGKALQQARQETGREPTGKETEEAAAQFKPKPKPSSYNSKEDSQLPIEVGTIYKLDLACDDNTWRLIRKTFNDPVWAAQVLAAAANLGESELAGLLRIERVVASDW